MADEVKNVSHSTFANSKPLAVEREERLTTSSSTEFDVLHFDTKATKRLLRKMDLRLVPFLALLYL